jgi:predicted O-methyltransferase YrrM
METGMNARVDRSAEAFIESLTGSGAAEIRRFAAEIASNEEFDKSLDDDRSTPGRRRFSSWGPGVGTTLGVVLYCVCRKVRPATVVETGVASGVSSSYILQSLEDNKAGILHSIDVPLWETQSGWIIPDYLRHRWRLIAGRSSDRLPPLLEEVGTIDVFLHDSEHSYENMLWEYQTAWTHLNRGGMLLSHNIDSSNAFSDFGRSVKVKGARLGSLGGLVKP